MSYDSEEFREIVLLLHFLSKQIEYVLHNYDFHNEELFGSFKWLEIGLIRIHSSGPGYDESKPLCRFIYGIFSGFDWVEGYRDYDFLEKRIREL
jgi:hypothetical protein